MNLLFTEFININNNFIESIEKRILDSVKRNSVDNFEIDGVFYRFYNGFNLIICTKKMSDYLIKLRFRLHKIKKIIFMEGVFFEDLKNNIVVWLAQDLFYIDFYSEDKNENFEFSQNSKNIKRTAQTTGEIIHPYLSTINCYIDSLNIYSARSGNVVEYEANEELITFFIDIFFKQQSIEKFISPEMKAIYELKHDIELDFNLSFNINEKIE